MGPGWGSDLGSGAVFWDLGIWGPSWGPGLGSGVRGSGIWRSKSLGWGYRLQVGDLGICTQMVYVKDVTIDRTYTVGVAGI